MEITPLKVNNVPTVHLNRINSPSAGTSLEKNGWARIPRLTLYLPKKLDIDSILRKNKPDFIYNRDKFVYILHLI